jgi:hypothetical protein
MHGLTYNLLDGKLYGANAFGTNSLYTINPATGAATLIGVHGLRSLGDLAFDFVSGKAYAADIFSKQLYTIDLKTAKATLVGKFGAGRQIGVGLAFDLGAGLFATDNLASSRNDDVLYSINVKTGAATLIGKMNAGNVLGLEFLDVCLPAISRSYGSGFRGTNGIPTLTATAPVIGKTMTLKMSNSRSSATTGLLILNVDRASIPAFWGGTIHVSLSNAILWRLAVPASGLSLPFRLSSSTPCGSVFAQGVLIDAGANAGLSNTPGLEMRVGK